jgi:hypothetical protein
MWYYPIIKIKIAINEERIGELFWDLILLSKIERKTYTI